MGTITRNYLRVNVDDSTDESLEDESFPITGTDDDLELKFIDLHTSLLGPPPRHSSQLDVLTEAIQNWRDRISHTDQLLFRWPWIVGPKDDHLEQIDMWIRDLTAADGGEPILSDSMTSE